MVRAEIHVDIGWDREAGKTIIVSEGKIRDQPDSLGGLRQAISPYGGEVDLDGRIGLHVPGRPVFLGPDFYIEYVRYMLGVGGTFCEQTASEMRLNGQEHHLRVSAAGDLIRFEIENRGRLIDTVDFPRKDIAREWFLAGVRFERVAAELGDVDAKARMTAGFDRLCPEFKSAVGEDRVRAALNDPIVEVFGTE